ncbi:DNA polymerase III subunit epsilon [Pseudactinotalea sp. HY158]|nr:DNA polymerase III subunit epsilon [Pseudactinotalea sp. HY158]
MAGTVEARPAGGIAGDRRDGLMTSGFAVIDFETTGVVPERTDRVIEVGVVLAAPSGRIEHEWTTLLNPRRDLGPTRIHGVRAADVVDAPDFGDVADHLVELLRGRTVVAHNASFDMRFLHAELARARYEIAGRPPALCSMKWAGRVLGTAKLAHCCDALDIELANAHCALDDARATARLVAHLAHRLDGDRAWETDRRAGAAFVWPAPRGASVPFTPAHRGTSAQNEGSWLESVLAAAWIPGSPEDEASYLMALDRALLDRTISVTEGRELFEVARAAGLGPETVARLHRDYLRSVAQEALADGVVTAQEHADLATVAAALGLGARSIEEALAEGARTERSGGGFVLERGDRVVFTGELRRGRDEWVDAVLAAGLTTGGVTKSTKVVVAADPDSLSGKAAKAKRYGLPIVTEEGFERLFAAFHA